MQRRLPMIPRRLLMTPRRTLQQRQPKLPPRLHPLVLHKLQLQHLRQHPLLPLFQLKLQLPLQLLLQLQLQRQLLLLNQLLRKRRPQIMMTMTTKTMMMIIRSQPRPQPKRPQQRAAKERVITIRRSEATNEMTYLPRHLELVSLCEVNSDRK